MRWFVNLLILALIFAFAAPTLAAEKVFDLAQATARTYQDVLEFLLGDGLEVYDMVEMLDYIAEGQGRLDLAV